MNDFLLEGYETPEVPSKFMEFEDGLNSFRILSSAIVGYEWWEAHGEAGRKPIRVKTAEEVPAEIRNKLDNRRKAKHFWVLACITTRLKPSRCSSSSSKPSCVRLRRLVTIQNGVIRKATTSLWRRPEPALRRGMSNIALFQSRQRSWIRGLQSL